MILSGWKKGRENIRFLGGAAGFSLLEVLLATFLFFFVLQSSLAVFAQFRKAVSHVAHEAEGLETVRTLAWLLSEELSGGSPGRDWGPASRDSVSLRAFRGVAMLTPGSAAGGRVYVCYRGLRAPNPEKDSVLLLGTDGRWTPHELSARQRIGSGCMEVGDGWREEWSLVPLPAEGVLARVFERGSYHIAEGAFRYRRGRGGRQPLTPERISGGGFLNAVSGPPGLTWEIGLEGYRNLPSPRSWRGVAW